MTSSPKNGRLDADRFARIADLFDSISRLPVAEREQALARLPAEDAALAPEVRKLLERAPRYEKFLSDPIAANAVDQIRKLQMAPTEISVGEFIGDFEVIRPLGRGGAGVVYLCRQASLDRRVALKVVPLRRSLRNEARAMAVLDHENIVQVFSEWADEERGLKFLAMQYVPGIALDTVERELKAMAPAARTGAAALQIVDARVGETITMDPAGFANREQLKSLDGLDSTLVLGIQLANALAYAHERGVLHLDVKSANVLLTPSGRPMLADFGVALRSGSGSRALENLGGTVGYMPPEQLAVFETADGTMQEAVDRLDGRADVFALGKLLGELLQDLAVPDELRAVIRRATRERREERFATVAEFGGALESLLDWRRANRAMPAPGFFLRTASNRPLVALTLAGALPQLVASVVGFQYNSLRVVSRLSDAQQVLFQKANGIYTPVVYVAAAVVWLALVARLDPYFRKPSHYEGRTEALRTLRRWALRLPWMGAVLTLLSWLPVAVLLPATMHFVAGPLDGFVMFHLSAAFVLSCSLALGYCFLLHSAVVLRILYPRMWMGDDGFARRRSEELGRYTKALRAAGALVTVMPLLGAFLILWQGAERTGPDTWFPVQLLVSGMMLLAVLGMTVGTSVAQRLLEAIRILQRR